MSVGNYATVNGHPIYYEQFGDGRPVVLLHGGFIQLISHLKSRLPLSQNTIT